MRFDRYFDPNPDGAEISYLPFDPTAASNLFIAGLDFSPSKDVHIIPNVEIVVYDEPDSGIRYAAGIKPGSDVMPRITLYYRF